MKKKCLLLGAAGFIGKNLAMYLKKLGYELTLYDIDILNHYSSFELENCRYIEKNFFEDEVLDELVRGHDIVFHLISSVAPVTSMENPDKCYRCDVAKTVELLENMKKENVRRMIFISSGGTVYGKQESIAYTEDMSTYPSNHYGIMKLTIEKILLMYNDIYQMDNIILRLGNPYGIGQDVHKMVGAVAVFADKIMKDEKIVIYGDGETIRDYIYIDDVVSIMEKFINYLPLKNNENPIYNVGTGFGTSINQIVKIISDILNKSADVEYVANRSIDVKRNVLSMNKTNGAIGNQIRYDIKSGIKTFIKRKLFE